MAATLSTAAEGFSASINGQMLAPMVTAPAAPVAM